MARVWRCVYEHRHALTRQSIESMLRKQRGIESVTVALLTESAVVRYDTGAGWTPAKVAEEIEEIGFDASIDAQADGPLAESAHAMDISTRKFAQLQISGMTCGACVAVRTHAYAAAH